MLCNCILYLFFAKGDCPSFSLSFTCSIFTILTLVSVIHFIFEKKGVLGIICSLSFLVLVPLGFLLVLTSSISLPYYEMVKWWTMNARTKGDNPYTRTKKEVSLKTPFNSKWLKVTSTNSRIFLLEFRIKLREFWAPCQSEFYSFGIVHLLPKKVKSSLCISSLNKIAQVWSKKMQSL